MAQMHIFLRGRRMWYLVYESRYLKDEICTASLNKDFSFLFFSPHNNIYGESCKFFVVIKSSRILTLCSLI